MMYDFNQIIERIGTNAGKWEFMNVITPHSDQDTLPFWVADMDFPSPQPVIDAMKKRADRLIFGYSLPDETYYKSVSNWMKRRFDWNLNFSDIFLSHGVLSALKPLVLALTSEGDGVIIQRPVYMPFSDIINQTNRTLVNNALINDDGYYRVDFEDLERKAKNPNNKMMIFCSPHNPVGRVWTEEELKKIANICLENDVILISDEIHFDLLRKGVKHIPIAKLFPDADKIITCTAPSKTFNIAGLHMANIIIRNKEYQQKWSEQVGKVLPSPIAIPAVQAAYDEGEDWLDQLTEYLDDNFKFTEDYFKKNLPKAKFKIPEGTYFVWVDLSDYGYEDKRLDEMMIKEANVLIYGGTIFGPEGSGFQRINIACPRSILEEGLNRICKAMNPRFE